MVLVLWHGSSLIAMIVTEIYYNVSMACVYGLVSMSNPSVVRYIGVTRQDSPDNRFKDHKKAVRTGSKYPVHRWMRKHEDVVAIILQPNLSWEDACAREIQLIKEYRSYDVKLLNVTSGGEGVLNLPDGIQEKVRTAFKGRVHTEESRKKISDALKGRPAKNKGTTHTAETKKKISDAAKNSTKPRPRCSEETKRKISLAKKGIPAKPFSEEHRRRLGESNTRRAKNKRNNIL